MEPKQVWPHEAHSFTPWLAEPDNLAQLGEVLGIELELEAVEQAVGPFRADILCKHIGTNHWVLIENQLERTDHSHLGQILTYAAGLDAVTIVWLSPQFTEEHRACLDWLNRFTTEGLNFFGVQIEVWQIGDSMRAPRFHIVSKPNEWSRSVAKASATIGNPETAETQLEYWSKFREALTQRGGPVKPVKPLAQNWISMSPFKRGGFSFSVATNMGAKRIKIELYLSGKNPHARFVALKHHQAEVEAKLGALTWYDAASKDRMVQQFLEGADPMDKADWPRQHEWLVERLSAFYNAFAPIIKSLEPAVFEEQA
ncbi:MAG: DUF4268 domain-containing protein [Fimbriimonadales bacterium]